MITGLLSYILVATVILVPKNGKEVESFKPAATPEQDLIFEERVTAPREGVIEPSVVLRKVDKKKKVVKIKKGKKGKTITIGPPEEDVDDDINDIINRERQYFQKEEESSIEKPPRSAASVNTNVSSFEKIEKKYKTSTMSMDVSKEVTQVLLDKTRSSSGELWMAPQGKLRLEINDPVRSLLVINGKNIWVIDYPVDGMQNKVQILRGKVNKALKNQAFLGFLMGQEDILSVFSIEDTIMDEDLTTYKLKPKKKDQDVQKVEIQMDGNKELISRISYWDQLGNKTQLEFSHQKERSEVSKDKFEYSPPKDSEVTEL